MEQPQHEGVNFIQQGASPARFNPQRCKHQVCRQRTTLQPKERALAMSPHLAGKSSCREHRTPSVCITSWIPEAT
eukprot:1936305-Amphidinium_carterae.1